MKTFASWLASLRWQTIFKAFLFVALLYAANQLTQYVAEALDFEIRPSNEDVVHRVITTAAILYALLLALPFVPGAEIGMALLVTLGAPIAFLVYICTLVGLSISFLAGRLIPIAVLRKICSKLGAAKLGDILKDIEPLERAERLGYLTRNAPTKMVPWMLRFRYIGLGLLFNLPGNFLIGGGGGISLIAGMSGLFSFPFYLLTVMIAVSPVPLAVIVFGPDFLR